MRLVLSESQSQCVTLPEASLLLRETDGMDTIVAAHVVSEYRMVKPFEQICYWWGRLDTTSRGICSALRAGSSGADFSHPLLPAGFSHDLAAAP